MWMVYDEVCCGSVEHGFDLIVEGLIIEIVDFDGLEVLLGIEVSLGDEEGLSED